MDLPDSILDLPKDLQEDVEAVQNSGGPAGLEAELQKLKDLRRVNQELLVQTEEMLQKEARQDAHFRSKFGTKWKRPESNTVTKNMQDSLTRIAGKLKQAAECDHRIECSVREHSALMSILDPRPIESALPTLAKSITSYDKADSIVGSLKQSLKQLEILVAQRAALEDVLEDMKRKDYILPKLMTSTDSNEDLFKEIAKHSICEEIAQNIKAQEQLLLQMEAQNAEFYAIFNLEDYKASREKCYKQIEAAIAKFREIKDKINEGFKFYGSMQDAITNMKQNCSEFIETRNTECKEMIEDSLRQVGGLSFQTPYYQFPYGSAHQPPPHQSGHDCKQQ